MNIQDQQLKSAKISLNDIRKKTLNFFKRVSKYHKAVVHEEIPEDIKSLLEEYDYRIQQISSNCLPNSLEEIKPVEDKNNKWDSNQKKIITWPGEQKLLVDAGPGTGKTDVACARVAWLIDRQSISPARILLISFTQAAVREIRDRIVSHLNDPEDIGSIEIRTLDSYAWTIHSGFGMNAKITGGYEENINNVIKILEQNSDDILDYIESFEHIIIDEAQDVVNNRADLIEKLLDRIDPKCGVTIFTDDAQAIYTFTNDSEESVQSDNPLTLSERIQQKLSTNSFHRKELFNVYRTDSLDLIKIFTETRKAVINKSINSDDKYKAVIGDIKSHAHSKIKLTLENAPEICKDDNKFILFRTRGEALMASSFLGVNPHRIRMSGLPRWIEPWIGACLSKFELPFLDRDEFFNLWKVHVEGKIFNAPKKESAWKMINEIAGNSPSSVDILRLRMILGKNRPPASVCFPEFGYRGPIIGTIHASKGREAAEVGLMFREWQSAQKNLDFEEESRIYYVGATRARNKLSIGNGYRIYPEKISSPRIWRFINKTRDPKQIQVQVGMDGDITPESVAGKEYYKDSDVVEAVQKNLHDMAGSEQIFMCKAKLQNDNMEMYILNTDDDINVGCLSDGVFMRDIKSIAQRIYTQRKFRYVNKPEIIKHIRLFGVRTIVVPPDLSITEQLYEPWSQSGFMLAPVILAFPTAYYKY